MKEKKVVCIDATPGPYGAVALVEKDIYTAIGLSSKKDGYILKEVKDSKALEGSYSITRFRDVDYGFGEQVIKEFESTTIEN